MAAARRIVIHPYDKRWPTEFAVVERLLRHALVDVALRIDDIGSTSVPGLAATSWRATHLHVRAIGRSNHRYALLFRDHLRHSPTTAAAYAQVKMALARSHPDDVATYYDVKDPVCDLIMDAAERWAAEAAWSP